MTHLFTFADISIFPPEIRKLARGTDKDCILMHNF